MAYSKEEFKNGMTLEDKHLNKLQDGVYMAVNALQDFTVRTDGIFTESDGTTTDLSDSFSFDFSTGSAYNGTTTTSSVFITTTSIDISDYVGYRIKMSIPLFTTSSGGAPNFYNAVLNESGTAIYKIKIDKNPNSSTLKGALGECEFVVPEGAKTLLAHMFNTASTQDASLINSSYTAGLIVYEGSLDDFYCNATEIIVTEITSNQEVTLTNPGVGYTLTQFDHDEICDYYAIMSDGTYELADGYGCSSFIPCKGSFEMAITLIRGSVSYGLAFYDENKSFLSFVESLSGSTASILTKVTIPEGAAFFKASYFNYETAKTYGLFKAYMFTDNNVYVNGKRPYQTDYIWFSQQINQSPLRFWETDALTQTIDDNYKVTTGVVTLPKNYDPKGKPVPLLMYCHGFSHYVYYSGWGANDTFLPQKKHWTDMGFAVMDVNGARDNNRKGNFQTGFCPQGMSALKQCVEYVKRHYNVEQQIYIVCGSAGGTSGWNYSRVYTKDVKAMVAIATWTNIKQNCFPPMSSAYVEFLDFESASTYDSSKTVGLDPYASIITIDGTKYAFSPNIPVLYVYGTNDKTDFVTDTKNFTTYLRNAGLPAQIRAYEGLGHEIVSGANEVVDRDIGLWLLQH